MVYKGKSRENGWFRDTHILGNPHGCSRRKFRSQTSDNMDKWNSRGGKSQRGEAKKWEEQRRERVMRKKMRVREKVGMICGSGSFKKRLAKAAGAEPSGQIRWEMKNCTPLWRKAHFQVKMHKAHHSQTTFDFWKLRCRKSARRCGAKHISESKCTKHTMLGPLLDVQMSKKCTPFWREAHFQVKMYKTHCWKFRCRKSARRCGAKHMSKLKCTKHTMLGPLLDVQMSKKCTPLWHEAHLQVKIHRAHHSQTTFDFWKLRCRKSARRCGAKHISESKCTKHTMLGPLLDVQMSKKCTPFWREAHFQVKSVKNWWFWAFFDVQMSKKCTLTNLTNLTNLTYSTNLTSLTNTTHVTNLT